MPTTKKKTTKKKKDEPTREQNLAFWNSVEKTDPSHTKPVTYGRGFTSIDAHYQIKEATARWGMLGNGWGVEVEIISDAAVVDPSLVGMLVTVWYKNEEGNKCYGVPILATAQKNRGENADDDAFKKATTDGLTKGLSYFGFNADVFLGRFDDNKYIEKMREEFKEPEAEEEEASPDSFDREDAIERIEAHGKKNDGWLDTVLGHYTTDKVSSLTDEEMTFVLDRIKNKETAK